jgi:hypothetical protein
MRVEFHPHLSEQASAGQRVQRAKESGVQGINLVFFRAILCIKKTCTKLKEMKKCRACIAVEEAEIQFRVVPDEEKRE